MKKEGLLAVKFLTSKPNILSAGEKGDHFVFFLFFQ
jgi:hypothetical protein